MNAAVPGAGGGGDAPGYVAICCAAPGCRHAGSADTHRVLRECVHTSRYGVLVVGGCVCGSLTCRTRAAGQMVILQAAGPQAEPHGPAVFVGPLTSPEDLAAVRGALRGGRFNRRRLPDHLVALHHRRRAARWN